MSKKGLVFGVFDGLHQGHKYFLKEASQKCEELVVVLTLDDVVKMLKKKTPKHTYAEREKTIERFISNTQVVAGDAEPGTWKIFKKHRPDIVILGYDQEGIARELEKMNVPFIFIDSHMPEKYKSSLINS